jgi:hypothetical protein
MKSARKARRKPAPHVPAPPETMDPPVKPVPRPGPGGGDLPSIIRSAAARNPASAEPTPIEPEGKGRP